MAAGLEDLFGDQPPGAPDEAAGERKRALVVAAHPDDADFGAGGTAALLARAGWEVRYLVVTDGSKGSDDPAFTPETLVATRAEEQRVAAAHLGVLDVRFLGYTDGELVSSRELLGRVTREIREFQPFAVYTHDPEPVIINNSFVNHNDHRVTGLATVDAVYPTARDRLNFPEHLAAASRRTRCASCTCGARTNPRSPWTSRPSWTRRSRRCCCTGASSPTRSSPTSASAGSTRRAMPLSSSAAWCCSASVDRVRCNAP